MSKLSVYRNDVIDHVIAESEEDALAVLLETGCYGSSADDLTETATVFERVPDDKVIAIDMQDGGPKQFKTAAEWIAQEGRGFLCSTEY